MPKFRAYLQITELNGSDPASVRQSVEESIGKAGLTHWRVVSIENEDKVSPLAQTSPIAKRDATRRAANVGGYLLAGAVAWALWFFWTLLEQ